MNEMVERVARAIYDTMPVGERGWDDAPAYTATRCREIARAAIAAAPLEQAEREARAAALEDIERRVSNRLNNHLVEMKEGYDDSIVGFNEAWDIWRGVYNEVRALAAAAPQEKPK
jgi:hypothetical protein